MQNSSVSLLTAVIAGVILFLLGVAWTRVKSARGNYRTIKKQKLLLAAIRALCRAHERELSRHATKVIRTNDK